MKKNLRWLKLDNAAKIYPAARRKYWTNVFRISVTFRDDIDPAVLQSALDVTVKRFPSVAVRLRTGVFWYYLEEIPEASAGHERGELLPQPHDLQKHKKMRHPGALP